MSTFRPNEIVDVHIEGARVSHEGPGWLNLFVNGTPHKVQVANPAVTVTRRAPAEWPPRPGDLWKDRDGTLWFAVEDNGSQPFRRTGLPYLMCGASDVSLAGDVAENWGPLTLVHREDEVSEP